MNPQIAKDWVAALRSGKFVQASGALHNGPNSYCCLGVLCELHRQHAGTYEWVSPTDDMLDEEEDLRPDQQIYCGAWEVLPDDVRQWAGLVTDHGSLSQLDEVEKQEAVSLLGTTRTCWPGNLAAANDEGATFAQIADIIEKYADKL